MHQYEFPRPGLTVDLVILDNSGTTLEILLVKRRNDPYAGYWALPGGYVEEGETLEQAAKRELREETNLVHIDLEQIGAFGDPGRDPRGWTVTVAFYSIVNDIKQRVAAGDDAKEAKWFRLESLPDLAFDHAKIINTTIDTIYYHR